jgi:hypothetical protein
VEKACRQAPTAQSATMSPRRREEKGRGRRGGEGEGEEKGGDEIVKRSRGKAKRLKVKEMVTKRGEGNRAGESNGERMSGSLIAKTHTLSRGRNKEQNAHERRQERTTKKKVEAQVQLKTRFK